MGRGRENHARQRSRHVTLNFCHVNLIRLLFHPLTNKTCVFTYTHQAGARLSLSIKEVDQTTGEDLMPGRGHEAAAKLADELKSNPSGPAGAAAGGKAASNPLHPGLTQERLRAMEAEEEVSFFALCGFHSGVFVVVVQTYVRGLKSGPAVNALEAKSVLCRLAILAFFGECR